MEERYCKDWDYGGRYISNYIICPGLCPNCKYYSIEKGSNWGPYNCRAKSNRTIADKAVKTNIQYDNCECYKEKQIEQPTPDTSRNSSAKRAPSLDEDDSKEKERQKRLSDKEREAKRLADLIINSPQQTIRLNKEMDQAYAYGKENNLVRVFVCLPNYDDIDVKHDITSFLDPYKKINLFVDASNFDKEFVISIPIKGIKKINESNKMRDYHSNKKKKDMFAINYKDGYAIVSPEKMSKITYEADEETIKQVDSTRYAVWLKDEELLPFLNSYNKIIKKRMGIIKTKKVIKFIFYSIIGLIIFGLLVQMCE
jgi:hypothetical protein